jgi:menaquinone-dependent protoporphyrinogen oxidase
MARVLVLYGTTEGHARKIAEWIGEEIRKGGHTPVVVDSARALPGLMEEGETDAAIVCGSVHHGRFHPGLVHRVRENLGDLGRVPSAFVSVSLTAAFPQEELKEETREYAAGFLRETGWRPDEIEHVAGALLYTKYDFMKGMLAQLIARSRGGDTDRRRDHEYTDWIELERFVARFLERIRATAGTRTGAGTHAAATGDGA